MYKICTLECVADVLVSGVMTASPSFSGQGAKCVTQIGSFQQHAEIHHWTSANSVGDIGHGPLCVLLVSMAICLLFLQSEYHLC